MRPIVLGVHGWQGMLKYLEACCLNKAEFIGISDANQVLRYIENGKIDIIITALAGIGKFTGFELCRQIRSSSENDNITLVITSSMREYEFKQKGMDAGADLILTQPFSRQEVWSILEKIKVPESD